MDRYDSVSISPDSSTILIANTERDNSTVDYRTLENLQIISRLRIPGVSTIVKPANFDPTGKQAIVGGFDGALRLFDLRIEQSYERFADTRGLFSRRNLFTLGRGSSHPRVTA